VIAPQVLIEAKAAAANPITIDAGTAAYGLVQTLTAYPVGGAYLYRVCPYAVFRPGETEGSLYDCPASNTTFGAGERLEIEGRLVLQTNVTADDVGLPLGDDGCYCSDGAALIECATLPQS